MVSQSWSHRAGCMGTPFCGRPAGHPLMQWLCVLHERFAVTISQQWSRFINCSQRTLGLLSTSLQHRGAVPGGLSFFWLSLLG